MHTGLASICGSFDPQKTKKSPITRKRFANQIIDIEVGMGEGDKLIINNCV